jgi:hypothetical protein
VFSGEEADEIRDLLSDSGISFSLHGHLHQFSFDFDEERDLYQYTVGRVEDLEYGMMTINPDEIVFENCGGSSCRTAEAK